MQLSRLSDPYRAYNFLISLIDSSSVNIGSVAGAISTAIGGFSECSGLEASMETEDYQEGGNNGTTLKFPKHISYSPIQLKRGLGISDELWRWFYDFVEGQGKRKDGVISLLNEQRIPVKLWYFKRGLPVKWSGPALDAARGQLAIQGLEIAHEGLKMVAAL